jgi:hypothetical protein
MLISCDEPLRVRVHPLVPDGNLWLRAQARGGSHKTVFHMSNPLQATALWIEKDYKVKLGCSRKEDRLDSHVCCGHGTVERWHLCRVVAVPALHSDISSCSSSFYLHSKYREKDIF